jgi:ADP-heptose:LPS heptosyltransferase
MTPGEWLKKQFLRTLEAAMHRKPLPVNEVDWKFIDSILVIRQHDQLGDFLLASPVFRALRLKFPEARIGVVTREYFSDVAALIPFVDEVITVPGPSDRWNPSSLAHFIGRIRSGWKLAVVLNTVSHSLTSDLIAWLSRAAYVLGSEGGIFAGCRSNFLYNLHAPVVPGPRHQTDVNLDIVRFIGADTRDLTEAIVIPEEPVKAATHEIGGKEDRVIGMHIGAGKAGNRWSPENFAALADKLQDEGNHVAVFSGPKEEDLLELFLKNVRRKPVTIGPTSLGRLTACFAACRVVVCNDTGVLHCAAATGTPVVGLFGPTSPSEWMPKGEKHRAIRGANGQIDSISVEEVVSAVNSVLKSPGVPIR